MLDSFFPLTIFPQGSLSSSVITTVWVGVFVVCFFNLRFGWVLSGLIVPGFLVPLMIAKPWSVGVIITESVLTYLIVRISSNIGTRYWGLFEVFGRERFFALVLVSVMVRVCFDGWLLPALGQWVNNDLGLNIDFQNNLQSFGLIIIALLANTFWKPGLMRGLGSCLFMLLITYLIVRYGLSEWTNFNVSNLSYMYEDLSSSIFASPKAYIILLTTAYIASRMNMRYGWEYNGILIPSLLALQWYQPEKLLVTLVETVIILIIGKTLLKLPVLARMNIEGARLLLFFFNISFFYKMLIGYCLAWLYPDLKVSDYFALGYLLSTLLAIKMFEKNLSLRMIRVTTESSLVAVLLASIIGFILTLFVYPTITDNNQVQPLLEHSPVTHTEQSLADFFTKEKMAFYQHSQRANTQSIDAIALENFTSSIRSLSQLADTSAKTPSPGQKLNKQLNTLGYRLVSGPDYWVILETGDGLGRGAFILAKDRPTGITLEVPYPMSTRGVIETGIRLFDQLNARVLMIANPVTHQSTTVPHGVLRNTASFYHQAHLQFNQQGVLQIRTLRHPALNRSVAVSPDNSPYSQLWIKRSLPKDMSLIQLQQSIGQFDTRWKTLPITDRQEQTTYRNFATLLLSTQALQQAITQPKAITDSNTTSSVRVLKQSLASRLQSQADGFAPSGSEQYQIARVKEIRFFDREVVNPLIELTTQHTSYEQWPSKAKQALNFLSKSAASFGYTISIIDDPTSREQFLLLSEPADRQRYFWGVYVFRMSKSQNYMIEVPHPVLEQETLNFGIKLFNATKASILLISSTHVNSHPDGSADILKARNKLSLFNLIHQNWLRAHADKPQHIIQLRAYQRTRFNQDDSSDILVARGDDAVNLGKTSESVNQLLTLLNQQQINYRLVEGQASTAGYQAKQNAQQRYLSMAPNHHWTVLWLSPEYRRSLKNQRDNLSEKIRFDALSVPTVTGDLPTYLLHATTTNHKTTSFTPILMLLQQYIDKADMLMLNQLRQMTKQYRWTRWIDETTGKSFLVIETNTGSPLLVSHLHPPFRQTGNPPANLSTPLRAEDINQFIRYGRQPLLLNGATQ